MQPFTNLDDETIRAELAAIIDAYLDANPGVVEEYSQSAPQTEPTTVDAVEVGSDDVGAAITLPTDNWLDEDEAEMDEVVGAVTFQVFNNMSFTAEDLGVANFSERIRNAASDVEKDSTVDLQLIQAVGAKLIAGQLIPEDEVKKVVESGIMFKQEYAEG